MASNLLAMASNLLAMASNLLASLLLGCYEVCIELRVCRGPAHPSEVTQRLAYFGGWTATGGAMRLHVQTAFEFN